MDLMSPVGVKHRKVHRSKIRAKAVRSIGLKFGVYGLKALESGLIENRQLEAGRMVLKRKLKKVGSVWIIPFTDVPVTGKKSGVRMGKGKGAVITWVTSVKRGQILYELFGMPNKVAVKALMVVGSKLSVKTKIVVLKE